MVKDEKKLDYWRGIITSWRSSGLSQPVFCKREGISYTRFTYWRSRLNKLARQAATGHFIPISSASTEQVAAINAQPSPGLQIKLRDSVSFEVSTPQQVKLAAMLLQQLEGR